jgi:hypothetical protein
LSVVPLVLVASTAIAGAKDKPVSVEATSSVVREGRDLAATVRESAEKQVAGLDLTKVPKSSRFVVAASLVGLDTDVKTDNAVIDARVSVTVRDGRTGALRAMLSGKAKAETMRRAVVMGEDKAIEAAVESAMSRMPEVLRKVK